MAPLPVTFSDLEGHFRYLKHFLSDIAPEMQRVLLGRLLRVDLIKWVSDVRPPVCTSVRPQKVSSISTKFGL